MNHQLLFSETWALMPERLNIIANIIRAQPTGQPTNVEMMAGMDAYQSDRAAKRSSKFMGASAGAIAVLPLYGVFTQHGNMMSAISGAVSIQQFTHALRDALADDTIGQILIDLDSPGGSIFGVAELAAEIYNARTQKPIVAIANSLAASGAYWIGSAAREFYVTPGGEVGSIGVSMMHEDWSKAMDKSGIKTTFVAAGKYKTEGNPYQPLDANARAFKQSRVDEYYAAFTKSVAKSRNVGIAAVRNGMGQGRVLGSDRAIAEKMVDGIATYDQVIKNMQRRAKVTRPVASSSASVANTLKSAPRLALAQRELQIIS